MWARIEHNVVVELTDTDPSGRYHPSLVWVECPEDTQQGWILDGDTVRDFNDEEKLIKKASQIRAERDSLLSKWIAIRDITRDKNELGLEPDYDLMSVLQHIEDLRNVPQQYGFPGEVVWPVLGE